MRGRIVGLERRAATIVKSAASWVAFLYLVSCGDAEATVTADHAGSGTRAWRRVPFAVVHKYPLVAALALRGGT